VTAHQQLSLIIRNQAKLMSVPELVPDNRVLSLAIEISLSGCSSFLFAPVKTRSPVVGS